MRKIIVTTFMSLDGVLQSPGGPDEDRRGGFNWGGWQFAYPDDIINDTLAKIMGEPFDLLLGRRTYEIFAAYWPYSNDEIGEKFNRINKYVVATTAVDTSWVNTVLISNDVVDELKKLKAGEGPNLLVHGSSVLVQTLLEQRLVDVLHVWTYPVTFGRGKKLFAEGTQPQQWKLTESAVTKAGVFLATYKPDGEVRVGTYETQDPSAAELARRERWMSEER
jgi:dihydrofolate reductase